MKGELIALSVNPETRRQRIVIELDGDFREAFDSLHGKPVDVIIKPYRRRRSLDANAYAWKLIDMLAAAMKTTKESIYRAAIRQIGGVSETVCVKAEAVDMLCEGWTRNGLGWQCERVPSKLKGCINVILYYGSSSYDTKQMSNLIEQLISDCHALGIETKSKEELESLLSQWENRHARD